MNKRIMRKRGLLGAFAIVPVALVTLLFSTPFASANISGVGAQISNTDAVASTGSVPKAQCSPGDHTESGLQGQTTTEERFSGDSERAYNCNLQLVGEYRGEGAYSQDGPAYDGVCAYYGTDRVTSLQQHHGVTVIDASDPQHPRVTAYLDDTDAALATHETVQTNHRRHLLAVGQNNGPDFAVYDISDCRHPVLKAEMQLPGSVGHMSAFAPDGMTYWLTQGGSNRSFLYSVDLTDPSHPVMLPPWHFSGDGRPHEVQVNPAGFEPGVDEGTRLYAGQSGTPDGLVIEDVSDYQFRRPNPQIRIISTLFWPDQGGAEPMVPVTIKGHPYLISSDESGGAGQEGGWAAACARGAAAFGYPQIIDVGDETNPKIVAKLMLEVNDPANCDQLRENTPPDFCGGGNCPGTNLPAASGSTNYSEERCVANNPRDATMLACSFQNAGLRVFDIRDPFHAKEIAYWKPPAVRTEVRPSSGSWVAGADRTVDKIAGWVRWHQVGHNWELWTVSDGNGFQVLRFTGTARDSGA